MALIQCSNCGKMISDKAAACPKCGHVPSENDKPYEAKPVVKKKPNLKVIGGVAAALVVLGAGALWLSTRPAVETTYEPEAEAVVEVTAAETSTAKAPKAVVSYDSKEAIDFNQKYFLVSYNGRYGVADANDKEILPCEYDMLSHVYEADEDGTWLLASKDGKLGIFNAGKGQFMFPVKYDNIEFDAPFDCVAYIILYKGDKVGATDYSGKWMLKCECDDIRPVYYAWKVRKGGKWGLYAADIEMFPCEYQDEEFFEWVEQGDNDDPRDGKFKLKLRTKDFNADTREVAKRIIDSFELFYGSKCDEGWEYYTDYDEYDKSSYYSGYYMITSVKYNENY